MKIKLPDELILINLLVFILIVTIILLPLNSLRIILGLPFLLFLPGYTLIAALFPQKEAVGGFARIALSFAMSIVVMPLIGFIFNYTPWGITLESSLYSLASFILITSIVAWLRRKRLPQPERFSIEFQIAGWGGGVGDKLLSSILVIVILGALGMLGYAIATPKAGERFTEFYIQGLAGHAADYPRQLKVGEEAINMARQWQPDLILMDIMMPKVDGYTACSAIKTDQKIKEIPVVMLTGLGQELNVKLAKEIGADGYITKPFSLHDLLDTINQFLQGPK